MMLSAGRILKNLNLNKEFLTNVRLLSSLGLNEKPRNNSLPRRLKNEVEALESNTRRYGRIDTILFTKCLETIRNDHLTPKESLILLKCCGPLMFNKPKNKRIEYANQIWQLLKAKRVPLDVMHYNLLIKTYTENDHQFDPLELINEMKDQNIQPNHRTYEFVVNKYCLDGDLDKVTKILEKMNEEGLSLTAPIFDSLILAYFINKDTNQALETFRMMKESKLEITNTTFKNIIIGYLKNFDNDSNTVDSIRQLINENSVKFEITEITEILEQMPKNIPTENANQIKKILLDSIKESQGFYNDLSNCCYNLISIGEQEIVKELFFKYFLDEQSKNYFIKRLTVSVLKSDETNVADFIQFLKDLYPSFNFSAYTKGTLILEEFDLDKSLNIMSNLVPTLDRKDLGVFSYFVDKCKNTDELHLVTERYLQNLDPTWINHLKRNFLPNIKVDLMKFMEEHEKRNENKNSLNLLKLSIYCYYLDNLELELLKQFYDRFEPNVRMLSEKYLMEKVEEVFRIKMDKFHLFLDCIRPKIDSNRAFNEFFMKFCLEKFDNHQLVSLIDYYRVNNLQIIDRNMNESQQQKLDMLIRTAYKSGFEILESKLVNGEDIKIDNKLIKLRNNLTSSEMNKLFLASIRHKNYQLATFFFDSRFKFSKPSLIQYVLLMLKNGENKKDAIQFFNQHFEDAAPISIFALNKEIDEIIDQIKDDQELIFSFTDKISQILEPELLLPHLIHIYNQTQNNQIGKNIIQLNAYLKNHSTKDPVFKTMVCFIENRKTTLLQDLSDILMKKTNLERSEVYDELAIAFVYTKRYKQAIKVIETEEFKLHENTLNQLFNFLRVSNRSEVIKQFSILVYQNQPKKRKELLSFLNKYTTSVKDPKLFQQILIDIKKLNNEIKEEDESISKDSSSDKPVDLGIKLIEKTNKNKDELIEMANQVIDKKIELKINVECNLIEKLLAIGEIDKATDLVYVMLKEERYPAPTTIKNFYKELNLNGKLESIDRLEQFVPFNLKDSEFYKTNKMLTYLRTTNSEDEIKNCLKGIEIFSSEIIDQILTIKPEYEQLIVNLLKEKKKSNLHFIWLHFMKNSKYEKALDLVIQNETDMRAANLLFQPIINLVNQNNNLNLARQLVQYATKFDLKSNTILNIYNTYVKLCLQFNKIDEARKAIVAHYMSKPDVNLNLRNLDQNLLKKFDSSFINQFINK